MNSGILTLNPRLFLGRLSSGERTLQNDLRLLATIGVRAPAVKAIGYCLVRKPVGGGSLHTLRP